MNDDDARREQPVSCVYRASWTNEQRRMLIAAIDREARDEEDKKRRRRLFRDRDAMIRIYRRAMMH